MDLQSLMKNPVCSDMESRIVFPVAEPLNLDNTDISFLDQFSVLEDKEQFVDLQMECCAISCDDTSALYVDWFSENLNDNISFDERILQPAYFNQVLHPINSEPSLTNVQESFLTEGLESVDGSYSCDESVTQISDQAVSSEAGECNEKLHDHNITEKQSCLAGKKYIQMRKKNNVASQRSRKLRKQKNQDMFEKLKLLEAENSKLTFQANEMEKQRDALQKQLFEILSKK